MIIDYVMLDLHAYFKYFDASFTFFLSFYLQLEPSF